MSYLIDTNILLQHLLTFDASDFQRFSGITAVHPQNV
jgi:hypothetical protein